MRANGNRCKWASSRTSSRVISQLALHSLRLRFLVCSSILALLDGIQPPQLTSAMWQTRWQTMSSSAPEALPIQRIAETVQHNTTRTSAHNDGWHEVPLFQSHLPGEHGSTNPQTQLLHQGHRIHRAGSQSQNQHSMSHPTSP